MIHACGMVDLADDIVISPGFAAAARAALFAGAPVICDVEMVRHGVIGRLMPSDNEVLCLLNDPQVREIAGRDATTRSAAQVDLWASGWTVR
jgi:precorrin-8X/cobalt-precorrin-8 methylmutase